MEVASPLTFPGSKRSFACSGMEEDFVAPVHKRRRFDPSPFSSTATNSPFHPSKVAAVASFGGPNIKRSRTDYSAEEEELEEDDRTQEIQSLKAENSKLSDNLTQLQSEHDKVSHENRLLKKLVTHQHERQQHLQNELEKANKYKLETEERMRKMEQMILQLRYHLSTAGSKPDFINQYRPPDVY